MIRKATATFTRPANITPYATGDEISNSTTAGDAVAMEFAGLTETSPADGKILQAKLYTNAQGFTGDVKMYLYDSEPTMSGDNSPHVITPSDAANLVGFVIWSTAYASPTGSTASVNFVSPGLAFVSKNRTAGNPLYGVLVARGAITPASGQTFSVELLCESVINTR